MSKDKQKDELHERVEKINHRKTQSIFSEAFQTGWRGPFDFPTGITGFPK